MNGSLSGARILTLVFTDLGDSTALKVRHGDQAAGELLARHRALVCELADEAAGRIIDWAGDGCFLTFATASAALTFALCVQQAHAATPELPAVRIGLHMGEVSERTEIDGDGVGPRVEGLAVDLAARIGGLAQPGQILLSASAADSARQRVDNRRFRQPIRWQTHGLYTFKGIGEAIAIHEVGLEGCAPFSAPPATEKAGPMRQLSARRWRRAVTASVLIVLAAGGYLYWSGAQKATRPPLREGTTNTSAAEAAGFGARPAIAVLPFANLSPDPEQAYFADGLAEDLITRLSNWRAFPVIARNSSFRYRDGDADLNQISGELGVRYVVEGSVRRAGERVRVSAQLVDVRNGEQVWAETYDRDVTDVFALQDEISGTIAASLVGDLERVEGERAHLGGTDNLQAWHLYLLGLQHFDRYTLQDFIHARGLFQRAAELDPRFATALGYLAITCLGELMMGNSNDDSTALSALATASARRAVDIDPRDAVAHLGLASAQIAGGDLERGLESIHRAIDLNPSLPQAWIWLGFVEILSGNPDAAITATEQAQRLNPNGAMVWIHDNFALAHWERGEYEKALAAGQRLIAVQPRYFTGYLYVAMNAVALGRLDEARNAIAEGRRIEPRLSLALMQNYLGVSRGDVDARRNEQLRRAGLE